MTTSTRITDDDIEAFLSGRLDPERRAEVETWLDAHPERKAEVDLYLEQQAALREFADDLLDDPIPDRFLALLGDGDEDGDDADTPDTSAAGGAG